jgi:cytoskeleton protein RodZ
MADSTEQDRTPHADHAPSPGGRLRAARERKGLSLVEAADALRLDCWLVEALERDDFRALGAPVFVKGHLRKYAALTGEPADDILLAYHQRAGVQEAPPLLDRAALLRSASASSRGMPVAALLAVLMFGGAVGAWWWYEQPVERPAPVGALAAASIEAEPEPGPAVSPETTPSTEPSFDLSADAASASPSPALRPATTLSTPPSTNGATGGAGDTANASVGGSTVTDTSSSMAASAGTGLATASGTATNGAVRPPAAADVPAASGTSATPPATGAGATPAASPSPLESLSGANTAQRPEAVPAPATARAGEHVLVLFFTGDSWVEVHDGAGARLYYDLGQAGSRRTLRGIPPFQIILGHYAGVSIEMDGQPRAIPAGAVRGNTARFTLDPT